jgi:arylformamidase
VKYIEISHVVEPGMRTYPGLPAPEVHVLVDHDTSSDRYQNKSAFFIASLHLCGNTGTYVDSPFHRHRNGVDLAGLPLERLAHLPVRLVDARPAGRAIDADFLRGQFPDTQGNDAFRGAAVLIRTDWSQRWGSERYFEPENPFVTASASDHLVSAGAAFVGIDSVNIDDMADFSRPAHTILLGAGIPICEHLTHLDLLPASGGGGHLHAVPIAWRGGGTFPVRAYVMIEDGNGGHSKI